MASSSRRLFGQGFGILMAAAKTTTTAAAAAAGTATKTNALTKPIPVTPVLGKFLGGVSESSRSGATKKIWEYIKLHNLQNPSNKREILCDEKLKTIFDGKDKVGMLEIAKYLSPHFVKVAK